MSTNTHLIELERELEADLLQARRHIELGRRNAMDEINAHRESLGELCGEAMLKIEVLASDAEEELNHVRSRLAKLNLMLAVEEIQDLETFDDFRDRILLAMSDAEEDLGALGRDGEEWVAREQKIGEAWGALSRQLGLARMHLAHESRVAAQEFELERGELESHLGALDESGEAAGQHGNSRLEGMRRPGDLVGRVGEKLGSIVPRFKTAFRHGGVGLPVQPRGARHD
ncbi:MAG: hypothetical protein ACR2RV_27975 [Verrucomicrobiales bacterium]